MKRAVWIPLFPLLLLTAGRGSAYTTLSPARTWNCAPDYVVDDRLGGVPSIRDGDGGLARTIGAVVSTNAWNGDRSGTVIKAHAGSVAGFALGDGVPMLNLADPLSACTGSCLAATFTAYYSERAPGSGSWRIYDADIVTNATGYSWTSEGEDPAGAGCASELYIEGVMVHEIGHALGLGHSGVADATMYPTERYCNLSKPSTEADDQGGLNSLYGSGFGPEYDTFTNYLSGANVTHFPLCSTWYWSNSGYQVGRLRGPTGTNFDLYLWRWNGSSWVQVASSTLAGSSETVLYDGASGWYMWGVYSASGAGTYHFYHDHPW